MKTCFFFLHQSELGVMATHCSTVHQLSVSFSTLPWCKLQCTLRQSKRQYAIAGCKLQYMLTSRPLQCTKVRTRLQYALARSKCMCTQGRHELQSTQCFGLGPEDVLWVGMHGQSEEVDILCSGSEKFVNPST